MGLRGRLAALGVAIAVFALAAGAAVWASDPSLPFLVGSAVLLLVAAGLAGVLLAGSLVRGVENAAALVQATESSTGASDAPLPATRELRFLTTAVSATSARLTRRFEEAQRSSDELRAFLARLGEALSSSLDLNRTLAVVVETAQALLRADQALLLLATPEGDALYTKIGRGVETPVRLAADEGLAGHVARTGAGLRLPADRERAPAPAPGEPTGAQQLVVPLTGAGRSIGVLTLVRNTREPAWNQADLDQLGSFMAQASIAVQNTVLHQEAQRLSMTDGLTGLWNFRYFQLQADRELGTAVRYQRPLSMVIVDLDRFKRVNDRYGHQAGDVVLREVSGRLRDAIRLPDLLARYGGEEFVLLLPDTDAAGALVSAERLRAAIAATKVTLPPDPEGHVVELRVTCSIGTATYPTHARTVPELLQVADSAMYTAKLRGRNRVVGAGEPDLVVLRGKETAAPAPPAR